MKLLTSRQPQTTTVKPSRLSNSKWRAPVSALPRVRPSGGLRAPRRVRTPYSNPSMFSYVPRTRRKVVVCGKWPRDTEKATVEADLKKLIQGVPGVEDFYALGRYTSIAKVTFESSSAMWEFVKSKKDNKMVIKEGPNTGTEIWASVEKSDEERSLGMRTKRAAAAILDALKKRDPSTTDVKVIMDMNMGKVWVKGEDANKLRILERNMTCYDLKQAEDFEAAALPITYEAIIEAALAQ